MAIDADAMHAYPGSVTADDADVILEACDITKAFGPVEALRGASFTARRGELTALVGDNGAGKSTMLKCLSGVHTPDGGYFVLNRKRTIIGSVEHARSLGIEMVYQDLALVDDLTVTQNLFLNREMTQGFGPFRSLGLRRMRREAERLCNNLSVDVPSVDLRVRNLSGGQRQAVAIARGMFWGQQIVILDEPTAALGVRETGRVEQLVRDVVARGSCVIMVSHNVEQVMRLSDAIWVMRRGEVVAGVRTSRSSKEEVVSLITG